MLMKSSRRRRTDEGGQTLILALTFIAFFALVVGSILRFGQVTALQHNHTESTATTDATAEGGAAFAAADVGRTDVVLTCAPSDYGDLKMQGPTADKVHYTVNSCNPGGSASGSPGGGTGENCLLCILNQTPSNTPTTVVLTANRGITTTNGNDYINGSIASGTNLTANCSPSPCTAPQIRVLYGATYVPACCTPAAVKYAPAITDPLATLGAPLTVAGKPTGCASYNATKGCTLSLSSPGTYTINPGLWASLTMSGQADVTLTAGTYVFTGAFSTSGQGNIVATSGVTFYLACPNYGPSGSACPSSGSGRTGGYIDLSGNGTSNVTAPSSGQYKDVSVLADPNLLDPGGVASCRTGGGTCLLNVSGNGASISGTQDTRSGGISMQGNGGESISLGRLITNSLFISVSGNAGAGLSLSGPAPGSISTSTCGVFDNTVTGTASGGSTGRAVTQSQCGSASGIVDFNYGP
jgi:hypothetical protein